MKLRVSNHMQCKHILALVLYTSFQHLCLFAFDFVAYVLMACRIVQIIFPQKDHRCANCQEYTKLKLHVRGKNEHPIIANFIVPS